MINRLAILVAQATEVAGILALGCVCLTVIVLTDAEQAELPDEAADEPPWSWLELRQQPLTRAAADVCDIEALRATDDVLGLVAK